MPRLNSEFGYKESVIIAQAQILYQIRPARLNSSSIKVLYMWYNMGKLWGISRMGLGKTANVCK